ncbi:hypothetical protein H7100_01250 [Candidatus Saccharibacteria bacterium]|nr:hypothetical protein [Candidatus Saccharibacteria bacterium]
MSLGRKFRTSLAVGALVIGGLFLAPAAANATLDPHQLDQGDLTASCMAQYGQAGWAAKLKGATPYNAYSWKCVYNNSTNSASWKNVDINSYCQAHWSVWAATRNASDPYSWYCQGY